MAVDAREFVAEDCWLLIGVVTFALISLAGLAGLEGIAGALAIIGWFLLVPLFLFWGEEIAALLFDESPTGAEPTGDDALEELKRRYAAGEIDDAEFERRLERLVGVDDALEDVFSGESTTDGVSTPARSSRSSELGSRERETQRGR